MVKKVLCLFILVLVLSCEPDDICETSIPDTPSLVIRLYDANQPDQLKPIVSLTARGEGMETSLTFQQTDSIALPLRTTTNQTDYSLAIEGDEDMMQVEYSTSDTYISRACGFKTLFSINDIQIKEPKNWIQSIEIIDLEVVHDSLAHVKIFH